MAMKRRHWIAASSVALGGLAVASFVVRRQTAVEAAAMQAPRFEVDPLWPKPLPNHWVIGAVIGVAVDGKDNVWIIHRAGSLEAKEQYLTMKPKAAECCAAAPPVLQFNQAGDLIGSWGGAGDGFDWPS